MKINHLINEVIDLICILINNISAASVLFLLAVFSTVAALLCRDPSFNLGLSISVCVFMAIVALIQSDIPLYFSAYASAAMQLEND